MNSLTIKAALRSEMGATGAKQLRNNGEVPAVLYGGTEPLHISISENEIKPLLYTANIYIVNLEVGENKYECFLKDAQFHPVTDQVLHIDLFMPKADSEITVEVPVRLTGTAPGVLAGGKLSLSKRKLKVKALIENLPDAIDLKIDKLRLGMGIRIKEVNLPGVTILDAANNFIVQVKTARGAVEVIDETSEAAAEETPAAE
ncbi:MAG: 50S ribosomal protein L25 [Flavobacteriales bacterium]|nr:50S ribosomal protein L25 [Flavobacteriales bacterium]